MSLREIKLFDTYTSVYYWIKDCDARFVILQGGTSSSKTYSIAQKLAKIAVEQPNEVITIVASTASTLERGALRDFVSLIKNSKALSACIIDPSLVRGPYRFRNGSIIEFIALQDDQKARYGKRSYLFLNEVNSIDYESAKALIIRTSKQVYADFNSDARFWIHDEYVPRANCEYLISNYTHNRYCPKSTIEELLEYKRMYELTNSTYWKNKWNVYGKGKTGTTEGAVFDDVNYVRHLPLGLTKKGYGLDFGFANDPTAMNFNGVLDNELIRTNRSKFLPIYSKELIYQTGLNTPELLKLFKRLGVEKHELIVADSSNPDAISQIKVAGYNIVPAIKGPNSVIAGINAINAHPLFITHGSVNWKVERDNYKYKKYQSEYTNEPIDEYNHLWDALRYWYGYAYPANIKNNKRKRTVRIIHR